jgi:hypothetical protein
MALPLRLLPPQTPRTGAAAVRGTGDARSTCVVPTGGVSMNLMRSKSARALPASATGAHAVGTAALGSIVIGAAALGALAIGALSVGRLFVGRARIRRLEIDELVVRRIRIIEQLTPPPTSEPGNAIDDSKPVAEPVKARAETSE